MINGLPDLNGLLTPVLTWATAAVATIAAIILVWNIYEQLYPSTIAGRLEALPGDPVAEVLTRTRRLVGALRALGLEPPPRQLSATEISALGWASLDPISAQLMPRSFAEPAPRPLQLHEVAV